ncbi:MAG: hypothetical protein FWF90_17295 [Promicromonosporaceae bacterium]|nr:hypothetical protein [Promicromonosporaceae bacterium]
MTTSPAGGSTPELADTRPAGDYTVSAITLFRLSSNGPPGAQVRDRQRTIIGNPLQVTLP